MARSSPASPPASAGVWGAVYDRLQERRSFATPGDLARYLNPRIIDTPALELIDEKLVHLVRSHDGRLIISVPPQEGKSERGAFAFPLWALMRDPSLRIAITSYSHDVAARWGRRIKQAIEARPELGLSIRFGAGKQHEWELSSGGGGIFTAGVGGAMTGRAVDLLVIDDPHKGMAEADSDAERKNVWEWWTSTALTRLAPGAPVLLIQTRWHTDDLAGKLLSPDADDDVSGGYDWEYLNIPAKSTGLDDPLGRPEGEYLESARRRTLEDWRRREAATPRRDWDALYQGAPEGAKGKLFPRDGWKHWQGMPPVDATSLYFQSWDMAFKGEPQSDYCVGQMWVRTGANLYLIDQVRGQWEMSEVLKEFVAFTKRWPMAGAKLVEDKANGTAAMSLLKAAIPGLTPVQPLGSKFSRANAAEPFHRAGNLWLPRYEAGGSTDWVRGYRDELATFPVGKNDDQVDATSQAVAYALLPAEGIGSKLFNIG